MRSSYKAPTKTDCVFNPFSSNPMQEEDQREKSPSASQKSKEEESTFERE